MFENSKSYPAESIRLCRVSSHNYLTIFNRGILNSLPVCLLQLDHLSHLSDGV